MKPILYLLLILLVLNASFSFPKVICKNVRPAKSNSCMAKHKCCPSAAGASKNVPDKQSSPCKVCNFCPMCLVFVMPFKQKPQRDFATTSALYAELAQKELTGYNPLCWRPPNA